MIVAASYGIDIEKTFGSGFESVALDPDFAGNLATMPPLPDGCAF